MTLPAALFGPTVRVLRTAAGRRALQLALLVAGLLLLGFLCGEQAHAAERTPTAAITSAVPATSTRAVTSTGLLPTGQQGGNAVRQVTERVVTSVQDVVDTASGALQQVQSQVQTQSQPPSVDLPKLPTPTEPLPTQPLPAQPLPVDPLPTPVTPEPRPHLPGTTAPAPAPEPARAEGGHTRAGSRTAAPARPSAAAYGPDVTPGGLAPHAPAPAPAARHTAAPAPAAPAPSGDPDGVLGKQAADGTASRHGDAHAVTLDGRAPLRLLPGTAAHADAPRIRERHRDIPVFPG
ncbi:hypothetical protein ACFW1F_28220 [Streptomyces bungoensis]|uniref:hypothetical protein n=1 Tax=Streptomyces bungoensis TaxID=285568 RepID=UPI00369772DB